MYKKSICLFLFLLSTFLHASCWLPSYLNIKTIFVEAFIPYPHGAQYIEVHIPNLYNDNRIKRVEHRYNSGDSACAVFFPEDNPAFILQSKQGDYNSEKRFDIPSIWYRKDNNSSSDWSFMLTGNFSEFHPKVKLIDRINIDAGDGIIRFLSSSFEPDTGFISARVEVKYHK